MIHKKRPAVLINKKSWDMSVLFDYCTVNHSLLIISAPLREFDINDTLGLPIVLARS
jgi:hypothetical protein